MYRLIIWLLLLTISGTAYSQDSNAGTFMPDHLKKVVIIQPTGEMIGDLPEMVVLADTTELHKLVIENIKNSFINEFLDLYFITQIYLRNKHKSDTIEPAYLALTENQGGFAKFGFSIKHGDSHIEKRRTAYIDITVGQATRSINKLMSFTQLYPHEMGHVLVHLLCPEDTLANNTKSVNMHFFSIVTDYSTAFNEGFAEHIENVSRIFEKNESIKQGIFSDIQHIGKSSEQAIRGFERDFNYPLRLGYYKASMLNWYQKYEDYMRYEQATNGDIRYKSVVLSCTNMEDRLTYRNSGVRLNKNERRNYVQLLSTEGAISSFFTHVSTSDLPNQYLPPSFYSPFIYDTNAIISSPSKLFTPIQNQFVKYIKILHHYVVFNNASNSQLSDFIDGYLREFPSEAESLKSIFHKALGVEYTNELPPPLWVMIKDHAHRLLVFDPFDAITVPYYSFDINAAEIEDLLTIKGLTKNEAEKVIEYRNTHGYFNSWEELKMIPGLAIESSQKIIGSKFDDDYAEEVLAGFEPKLSITTLLLNPLKYVFSRATGYFVFLFAIIYFLFMKPRKLSVKQTTTLCIKYFLLCILFTLTGLVIVFLFHSHAYLYFILFSILTGIITAIAYRKNKEKRDRTLVFIGGLFALILASIL